MLTSCSLSTTTFWFVIFGFVVVSRPVRKHAITEVVYVAGVQTDTMMSVLCNGADIASNNNPRARSPRANTDHRCICGHRNYYERCLLQIITYGVNQWTNTADSLIRMQSQAIDFTRTRIVNIRWRVDDGKTRWYHSYICYSPIR